MTAAIQPSLAFGQADEGTHTPRRRCPSPPAWLVPTRNRDYLDLLEELIDGGAPNAVLRAFKQFHSLCQRYESKPGTWHRQSWMAGQLDLSISRMSSAIAWLMDRGYLAQSVEMIHGKQRTVFWALWLLDPAVFSLPRTVRNFEAIPLRNFESEDLKLTLSEEQSNTTTDGGRLSFFSEGEEADQTPDAEPPVEYVPETPAAGASPPPAIDASEPAPAELPDVLRAELLAVADMPRSSAKVAAEALKWVGRVELDWIRLAILEFVAKSRLANDAKPIVSADGWFRGMLETWEEKKRPQPVLARAALELAEKQAQLAAEAERNRLAAEAKRATQQTQAEQDAALEARWDQLDADARQSVEAQARLAFPVFFRPGSKPFQHRQACLMVLATRGEVAR